MKITHVFKNKIFILLLIILFSVSFSLVLTSCYPGDPISASDTDVVTTFRNATVDFSTKMTYSMPDSVIYITIDGPAAGDTPALDQQILSAIKRNMEQVGYAPESNPDQADVLIVPLATSKEWVAGGCYPWYYGWWYPYPGYCYPVAYSYQTGTILIIMVDPEHANDDSTEDALWIAGINGLLSSSSSAAARIDRDIDQAFKQSPYLSDGK